MMNLPSNYVMNLQGMVMTVAQARAYYGDRFNNTVLDPVTHPLWADTDQTA